MCAIDGKMKVDKAVSTTNDNAINDLHNGIRYDSILNTLVEKKILAIKRDCEQTEQKLEQQRKQNCLGGLLFGKRWRQHEQQPEQQRITLECPRMVDTIVINERAANDAATANDDAKNAIVLVNRNKLIENDNQQGWCGVDEANTKPNEQSAMPEDCGSIASIASHSAVQIDDVGESKPHLRPARKISSDTVISIPNQSKHTTFSAPVPIGGYIADQEQRRRLRVLEAKSISAQCSPIFPRQTFTGETGATLPPLTKLKSSIPQRLMSRQNTSDDSVSVTFSSVLVNEDALDSYDTVSDNVTVGKKLQQRRKDSNKLGRCSVANDTHGFISSFNQLTSSNNLPAVISTTKLRSGGGGETTTRVSRFQPMQVVETARNSNAQSQPRESYKQKPTPVPASGSDEDEPLKNDKRKNRKCWDTGWWIGGLFI